VVPCICLPVPLAAILFREIWPSIPPWVYLIPTLDVQAGQHCSTGMRVGSGRGIGLKMGDPPGWEPYTQLKVLKVLTSVCFRAYKPLLPPVRSYERSDRRKDYPHVMPYGNGILRKVVVIPAIRLLMVWCATWRSVRHRNVRMWGYERIQGLLPWVLSTCASLPFSSPTSTTVHIPEMRISDIPGSEKHTGGER